MSNTPETDAAINSQAGWKRPFVSITSNGTTYDGPLAALCRKLERERDEAIRARDVALKAAHTYDEAHTKACEGWAQAERERDDLRDRINDLLNRPALV